MVTKRITGDNVGIAVLNAFLQIEGTDEVLKNIQMSKVNRIVLTTFVEELGSPGEGIRFPSMATGFKRKIRGQDAIYVRKIYSSFEPTHDFYTNTFIKPVPKKPGEDIVKEAIKKAKDLGFKVEIIDAPTAVPGPASTGKYGYPYPEPGYDECKCVRVDGQVIDGIESKGCVNNPDVRRYALARIRDILTHYDEIDTLTLDHIEFPTYNIRDNFSCFCEHCARKAKEYGYNFDEIKRSVYDVYQKVKSIKPQTLVELMEYKSALDILDLLINEKSLIDWLEFRCNSVVDFMKEVKALIKDQGFDVEIAITGFTPTMGYIASRNYRKLADQCDIVLPKFYNEHWSLVVKWCAEELMSYCKELKEEDCLNFIYSILGFRHLNPPLKLKDIDPLQGGVIPPDALKAEAIKIKRMVQEKCEIHPFIHCWCTSNDLKRKLEIVRDYKMDGIRLWNYGLLTDDELAIISDTLGL